jgi:hypothetical protein
MTHACFIKQGNTYLTWSFLGVDVVGYRAKH